MVDDRSGTTEANASLPIGTAQAANAVHVGSKIVGRGAALLAVPGATPGGEMHVRKRIVQNARAVVATMASAAFASGRSAAALDSGVPLLSAVVSGLSVRFAVIVIESTRGSEPAHGVPPLSAVVIGLSVRFAVIVIEST
jgi:hypothetical protein